MLIDARLVGSVVLGLVVSASGEFIVPDGVNVPWVRNVTADSAYAQWEVFTSPVGPNAPDAGEWVGGVLPGTSPGWDVYDTSGESFITGGGSLYSLSAPLNVHAIAPNFGRGAGHSTTILLQIRTQGMEYQPGSVHVGGESPIETIELHREPLGPMGFLVDTLFRWEVSGNVTGYELRFDAAGPHMSLDRVAIDTWTRVIPAPGTIVLGMLALAAGMRRRR